MKPVSRWTVVEQFGPVLTSWQQFDLEFTDKNRYLTFNP